MKLRLAKFKDLETAVALGETFWKNSPYAGDFDYNPEGVLGLMTGLIQARLFLVVEHDDQIVAGAGLIVAASPFDPALRIGTELFWYVAPEVRGLGVGQLLLEGMEDTARENGAKICAVGNMSTSDPEAAERLYAKNGYQSTEKTFTKVL